MAAQTTSELYSGNMQPQFTKMDLSLDTLNAVEYIPISHDGDIKEREQTFVNAGDDQEPGELCEWITSLQEYRPELLATDTFFTFVNSSRSVMRKGSQAWYVYGNRTNASLLVQYGFCFKGNLFDSVLAYVRLEVFFVNQETFPDLLQMVVPPDQETMVNRPLQEIRFKRHQLNDVLTAYIRSCFRLAWSNKQSS